MCNIVLYYIFISQIIYFQFISMTDIEIFYHGCFNHIHLFGHDDMFPWKTLCYIIHSECYCSLYLSAYIYHQYNINLMASVSYIYTRSLYIHFILRSDKNKILCPTLSIFTLSIYILLFLQMILMTFGAFSRTLYFAFMCLHHSGVIHGNWSLGSPKHRCNSFKSAFVWVTDLIKLR